MSDEMFKPATQAEINSISEANSSLREAFEAWYYAPDNRIRKYFTSCDWIISPDMTVTLPDFFGAGSKRIVNINMEEGWIEYEPLEVITDEKDNHIEVAIEG